VDCVVRFVGSGAVDVVEAPKPQPADGRILVRTLYSGIAPGDTLWGLWGHRAYAVLDAGTHVGETVVVFGQGVIGLLATRLPVLSGATVVAVDAVPGRLKLTRDQGTVHTVLVGEDSPAEVVTGLTGGRADDVCVELSGAYGALHEAVRTAGYNGRVVAAGFYRGEASALRLGEEFHHNRVRIVASQISGLAAAHSDRRDRDRLRRGFMELVTDGRIDPLPLVTHVPPVEEAARAFELVAERPADLPQAVLDFRASGE
jgi:threonine dehydrogenase-like Zn-dependent dehydrogenase